MTITAPAVQESTVQERFTAAVVVVRAQGVRFRQNVRKCCTGCIEAADVGMKSSDEFDTVPGAYTYGSQNSGYVWRRGMPYRATEARRYGSWQQPRSGQISSIYVGHWGPGVVAATAVANAFAAQGFRVTWDGTTHRKVEVHIEWPESE